MNCEGFIFLVIGCMFGSILGNVLGYIVFQWIEKRRDVK